MWKGVVQVPVLVLGNSCALGGSRALGRQDVEAVQVLVLVNSCALRGSLSRALGGSRALWGRALGRLDVEAVQVLAHVVDVQQLHERG